MREAFFLARVGDPAPEEVTCLPLVERLVHLAMVAFDADAICAVDRRQCLSQ